MASRIVAGLVIPMSVAGHPALDFCNTRAGWGAPTPKEYLHSHAHLAVWAAANGLSEPAEPDTGVEADAILARAIAFRESLYAVLMAGAEVATLNGEIRRAGADLALAPGTDRCSWVLTTAGAARPLHAVAWSAAHLLTTTGPAGVSACPGDGCGWLFLNNHGRRRWCSMAWCGNRAKARRHAQRGRAPD